MSVLSYGEFTSQQRSDKVHPSNGVPQFKAPLRLQSGVQPGKLPGQGQRYSTPGSTSSKGVLQFKVPLRFQSGKLLAQNRSYSASGTPPFNGASLFQVTNPSQPVVQQPEMRIGQSGYPNKAPTDTYVGIPAPLSPLEALRQRRSSQFLRESDRSWQPALPQTEAQVRSEALRRIKTHVMMKVILIGGTGLLVGGIASLLLLSLPTYLVVTWAILIIVVSNLVSRELRSYYGLTPTTLSMEAVHPSTISTPQSEDTGRHPMLKDISGTTDYLKALCLIFNNDHPTQTFPPQKEYRV
jgi:hypothetical protein